MGKGARNRRIRKDATSIAINKLGDYKLWRRVQRRLKKGRHDLQGIE